MPIDALRTPDDRFADLPGYPWAPNYLEDLPGYEGLRMHYLDEGPADAEHTFLCLHGQPSWSYLYRKMIPVFVAGGGRVIAPDFFGFGRSDKPVDDATYTFDFHRDSLLRLIEALDLKNITLVCQDWGGLLGLTAPHVMPERFARLIIMNTALMVGMDPGPAFLKWLEYSRKTPDLPVGRFIQRNEPGMSDEAAAAYDAPFPDVTFKAGVRRFPELVPRSPEMDGAAISQEAVAWWSTQWSGASFMAVGVQDPMLGVKAMRMMRRVIRGCPEALEIPEAGHFVQEHGERIAKSALEAFADQA